MITVLPDNLSKNPLELLVEINYMTLKNILIETAKVRNMPIEVTDDTYSVGDGGFFSGLASKSVPCLAVCHTQHRKDYHTIVVELKEAYGTHYAYIHTGGTSRNQMHVNMGKSYAALRPDGEYSLMRPGLLGKALSSGAKAKLQDEELYYDAVHKLICTAIAETEAITIGSSAAASSNAPKPAPQPTPKPTPQPTPKTAPKPNSNISASTAKKESIGSTQTTYEDRRESIPQKRLQQSIGVETMGGVFTKLISAGTYLPTKTSMTFATAFDGQTSFEIHVLQGESEKACDNKSLGKYMLDGVKPAARGVSQIEVTFSVNDQGEFDLTARDKTSNKELKIFVDNLLNPHQNLNPQQPKEKEEIPTAVCPLSISESDEDILWWLDANVGFLTDTGVCASAFSKETYIPYCQTITLVIPTDDKKTIDIQVIESTGSAPEDNRMIGKFVLSNIPYSMKGELSFEFCLKIDFKGNMEVTAKNLDTGKYLPISFVPNHQANIKKPEPKQPDSTKQPAKEGKSKVEQLKELADLLDRGVLSPEEFASLKKSILYK